MADGATAGWVLAVVFVATVIRSAFGFGEALIAVPLLAFVIPVTVAAPLAVLFSITVAGIVVAQDWRHVHFASAWRPVVVANAACAVCAGKRMGVSFRSRHSRIHFPGRPPRQ